MIHACTCFPKTDSESKFGTVLNRIEWQWQCASLKEVPVYKKLAGVCSIEESRDSWAHGSSLHIVSSVSTEPPPSLVLACAEAGY